MNISHLIITIIGTSCLALVAVWVNLRILHNRVLINSKLHASVSASNQAVVHSTSENELIKRICDAGKMETGYLRMSVIDRFGNVFFDTDSSSNVIDSAFSYDLQDVFDQANKKEPFILKRSLMDVLKNRNNVAVAMVPIYDSGKVRFMLCALANRNFYVEAMHLDLLKEFVGDIEFGFKTFSLEKHKKDTIRRTNVMNRLFETST